MAGKEKKTKLGLFASSMGSSALKSMSRAGKQMEKAAVKAKQKAVEKIGNVPPSPEDPEIVAAEAGLKTTKNEIYALSDIVRNLYDARIHEATYLAQLCDRVKTIGANDTFGALMQRICAALVDFERVSTEHLNRMKEELVVPLENFRDKDIDAAQSLKLKVAHHIRSSLLRIPT